MVTHLTGVNAPASDSVERPHASLLDAMAELNQRTIRSPVSCVGIGLHSGAKVQMTLRPAGAGTGVVFNRIDLAAGIDIPARAEFVVDTRFATTLAVGGARIGTVEHLLAAVAGLGIDNLRVEVDGPEIPIMD